MNKVSNGLIKLYLWSSLIITTTSIIACFGWYRVEYYMAVDLYPKQPERAAINRVNALWLGLWGGVYGISGTLAGGALLINSSINKASQEKSLPKSGRDYD